MWFWVLVIFAVVGAIIGAMTSDQGGATEGFFAGLFAGGSCLFQILIGGLSIFFLIWLFGVLFG